MKFQYEKPEVVFKGKRVDVLSVETEHPKGGVIRSEVVAHPGAVVILPFLDGDSVVLIKNERYTVQQTLWELPAGTMEEENPLACAERELEEETGYRADEVTPLFDFYTSPGFCNEMIYAFCAKGLTFHSQNLDETEKITTEILAFSEVLKMIKEGVICDAKTICTLLYFNTYCRY